MKLDTPIEIAATANRLGLSLCDAAPVPIPMTVSSCLFSREKPIEKGKAKRKLEFDAGRFCVETALKKFGVQQEVGTSHDRCPIWPVGVCGSISHSDEFVWVAVGKTQKFASIGIDTEPVADEKTLKHLTEEILNPGEMELGQTLGLTKAETFTAIFSAKESFYKCVYPLNKLFFGFHDVVVNAMDSESIQLKTAVCSPNQFLSNQAMHVNYVVANGNAFAVCWLLQSNCTDR